MRTSNLMKSILGSWILTFIHNTMNLGSDLLLYMALAVIIVGLYLGLYANNEESTKEKA